MGQKIQRPKKHKKTKKTTAISEELGVKKLGVWKKNRVLCVPLCIQLHKGVGQPSQPPSQLNPWTHPYPHRM